MREADEAQRKQDFIARVAARLGLFRFKPSLRSIDKFSDVFQDFPPKIIEEMKAAALQAKFMDAVMGLLTTQWADFFGSPKISEERPTC